MNLDHAKQLFFEYDGSRFYMSRDGVENEYGRLCVPAGVESKWLEELTSQKLTLLDSPGNWKVLSFLVHHRDTRHLARVAEASPKGVFWQKCAYLEELLRYLQLCVGRSDPSLIAQVSESLLNSAVALRRRVRSVGSVARVDRIIADAESFVASRDED